jgi:MoaA/NifB/PqqE/SkfB family radical SAM enzyme
MNKNFCPLPWISIEASPIGTVRPCCLADDEIVDEQGQPYKINQTTFDTVRNSSQFRQLRQQFLQGEQPKTCRKCWQEEAGGRTSKRQHTLTRLQNIIKDNEYTLDPGPLQFVDLKLGNICNLKCRICGSWSSSTYAVEEIQHSEAKHSAYHKHMLKQGAWPREHGTFWQELTAHFSDIKYLEFTGGEPFLIKEHFDLLEQIVKADRASTIELHYNTNGTVYPEKAEQIWSKFRSVEIALSIDDIGERFEYQRSGAGWQQICDTLDRLKTLKARLPSLTIQVCITVNIFNVYYLEPLAQWVYAQGFDYVYWNMLHDRPEFCIAELPTEIKHCVKQQLSQADVDATTQQQFNQIINFMYSRTNDDPEHHANLLREITLVDNRRQENLKTVAPRWAEILFNHGR